MEASGGYERGARRNLSERGLRVTVVNVVRGFARASGLPAKTERLDAVVVARSGAFARPAPTPLVSDARQALAELLACRRQLTVEIAAAAPVARPSSDPGPGADARTRRWHAWPLSQEIARLIRHTIAAEASVPRSYALLTSMPGVGSILAATVLAELPEFGTLDRRQMASLVGVAAIAKDSGTKHGRRTSATIARRCAPSSTWPRSEPAAPPRAAPLLPPSRRWQPPSSSPSSP